MGWIRRFILFHHKRHPLEMGANEVSALLTHLAVARRVAASTQNQALSALPFLYREVLLGHKGLRTTRIYTHVLKLNGFAVRSPANRIGQFTAAHTPG